MNMIIKFYVAGFDWSRLCKKFYIFNFFFLFFSRCSTDTSSFATVAIILQNTACVLLYYEITQLHCFNSCLFAATITHNKPCPETTAVVLEAHLAGEGTSQQSSDRLEPREPWIYALFINHRTFLISSLFGFLCTCAHNVGEPHQS